ncbi:hypothetical protein [Poritiphilus flavus]|uniref:GIY-YIG domain-containing protein n=1 Tax=Poritiphilus flavus TaxID=2697053 RepID=A0A6L9E7R5_9FLAO|nr:hypothetical protein [Poritiphilus flavus]NAS10603.1 hypothetical protein [Poritiphilus flavus]
MQPYIPIDQDKIEFKKEVKLKYPDCYEKGVYELYYFDGSNPRTISRLFGADDKGILYIGCTKKALLKRVSDLQKTIMENSKSEQKRPVVKGYKTLNKKFFRIRKKIDVNNLYVSLFQYDRPKYEESRRLENYVIQFGELPPLNGQYGSEDPDWTMF